MVEDLPKEDEVMISAFEVLRSRDASMVFEIVRCLEEVEIESPFEEEVAVVSELKGESQISHLIIEG